MYQFNVKQITHVKFVKLFSILKRNCRITLVWSMIILGNLYTTCNICTQSFHLQSQLMHHIKTVHPRVKSYKSDPCGKSFSQEGNLKNHIHVNYEKHKNLVVNHLLLQEKFHINTIHKGHKHHKCESCGKSFSERRNFCTSILFMKASKITNVNLVANHFL